MTSTSTPATPRPLLALRTLREPLERLRLLWLARGRGIEVVRL